MCRRGALDNSDDNAGRSGLLTISLQVLECVVDKGDEKRL